MKCITVLLSTFLFINISAQEKFSNVEISDPKTLIINVKNDSIYKSSKLSSGEIIKTGCDHGACYFRIEYKGRIVEECFGDFIDDLSIFEFDFGNDGDKEIIVVNDFDKTSYLFIYSYSRGIIEKLFEKEILYYRTVINQEYIEYYLPSGLAQVWNFYQGRFWEMTQVEINK